MSRLRAAAPLPPFAWAARQYRRPTSAARVVLRDDLRDADGEPRICVTVPGRRLPLAFPNVTAALDAHAHLERHA